VKKLFLSGVVIVALAASGRAYSADLPVTGPAPAYPNVAPICYGGDIVRANNQVSADFVETHINYGPEVITPGTLGFAGSTGIPLDGEGGWVPGFSVTGSLMNDIGSLCNVYLMGRFTWLDGNTTYVGALQGNPYGSLVQTDGAKVNNTDFRLGKGFSVGLNWMLTPYFGVGTNWWDRFIIGPSGYDEKYTHGYVGGGLLVQVSPAPRWVISANGLVGSTVDSGMTTSASPGGYPFLIPTNFTLGSKLMYIVGGSIDYAISRHWHANVGVEYSHFQYGQSPLTNFSLEPNSTTSYLMVSVGAGFGW
jgi:hypothetical protein